MLQAPVPSMCLQRRLTLQSVQRGGLRPPPAAAEALAQQPSRLPLEMEPSDLNVPQHIACPWSQVPREPCCAPHPERTCRVPELGH